VTASARVLILAGDAGSGLDESLGADRAGAVRALLVTRARQWAKDSFGVEAVETVTGGSFVTALQTPPAGDGPLIAIVPELPVWHPELAPAVLGDLEAGCALALAPMFDRGLYLLAIADRSAAGMEALAALDLTGPGGMTELIGLSQREGWELGLLRAERGLRRARDVRALLADPLTDPELRALLA